jgi:hypothetical protein
MGVLPAVHLAAPLDRAARVVTGLTWGLAGGFVLLGAWIAAADSGAGWLLVAIGILIGAMLAYFRRLQPVEYVVDQGTLTILRRAAGPRRFAGASENAHEGALGLRIAGSGGAYGYLGRFRAEGRTVRAYVTDRHKVLLLDVGRAALAISPGDRDAFLTDVGHGA